MLVGYPPSDLMVVSPNDTWSVTEASSRPHFWAIHPGISRDGNLVATARLTGDIVPRKDDLGIVRQEWRASIAIFSIQQKTWAEYGQINDASSFQGSVAIAPDGSKLAFAEADARRTPIVRVHVIELKNRTEKIIAANGLHGGTTLSWAPDGRRLVYDTMPKNYHEGATKYLPGIEVLDMETGKSIKIANGEHPAWSPSSEWIAYEDPSVTFTRDRIDSNTMHIRYRGSRLMLVRPDGTDSRVLLLLGRDGLLGFLFSIYRSLAMAPVWSPDSKTLLLNEWGDIDAAKMDIYLLDLATLKMTRKFNRTTPVYGWAEAK
ncbi:MAG TPA: hypothetical protein VGQ11_02965 [Candidatus Acidoferrales bacterium]|nr:hypothetical protein [Candidatus Acidoferrales bacterium]